MRARDACERCHGERGGAPGNENVVGGWLLCDDCSVDLRPSREEIERKIVKLTVRLRNAVEALSRA